MAAPLPPGRKTGWDIFQLFTPLLQTIVTVVVGGILAWMLTGRITTAIQKRQLELSHVQAMREIYLRLQTDSTEAQALADAHALAMFRDYAVAPLIMLLQRTDPPYMREAAMAGLRGVAITDSALIARQMIRIVSNESGLYTWPTLKSGIQLLGELQCAAALRPLERAYTQIGPERNVDSALVALQARASSSLKPVVDDLPGLQDALQRALHEIRRRDHP